MRSVAAVALAIMLLSPIAEAAECDAPADLHDGWNVDTPAQQGLDPKLICAMGPKLAILTEADPNGVVVVRHGVLVFEHYFVGGTSDLLHGLQSVTKSVVAALVGIAFDRGWLNNINASALSFFPEYADLRAPDKDQITLRDLLTMTSGLKWPESEVSYTNPANIADRMGVAPDPDRLLLARPFVAPPGMVWNYNSGRIDICLLHRPAPLLSADCSRRDTKPTSQRELIGGLAERQPCVQAMLCMGRSALRRITSVARHRSEGSQRKLAIQKGLNFPWTLRSFALRRKRSRVRSQRE
jgi:Beta-lactamase